MPANTQNLEKYLEKSENLYEAAMIISTRARQINEEQFQKMRDRQILEELEGEFEEDFLHSEEEKLETEEQVEPEENPIVTSGKEYMSNKLNFQYEPTKK